MRTEEQVKTGNLRKAPTDVSGAISVLIRKPAGRRRYGQIRMGMTM